MKKKMLKILSLVLALSFLLSSVAFASGIDTGSGVIRDDNPIHPLSTYTICDRCESRAPLWCMNSKICSTDNVTSHSYSGGTCYRLQYMSYAKFICGSCGYSVLLFSSDGTSLARHYCDTYHRDCGVGVTETCNISLQIWSGNDSWPWP